MPRPKTFGGKGGRIPQICSRLSPCAVFADIGCDHGYCTQYMLKNNLCSRAVISDVSEKSLAKAQKLLKEYAAEGRLASVCCDGLKGVEGADLVLIAGMGGEEIVKILRESYIPENFVLQPMKNAPALRSFLLEWGCEIVEDTLFKDGKYYFIIKGKAAGFTQPYTRAELAFGRHSLKNPLFKEYLKEEIYKSQGYLSGEMSEGSRAVLTSRLAFLNGVLSGEIN